MSKCQLNVFVKIKRKKKNDKISLTLSRGLVTPFSGKEAWLALTATDSSYSY